MRTLTRSKLHPSQLHGVFHPERLQNSSSPSEIGSNFRTCTRSRTQTQTEFYGAQGLGLQVTLKFEYVVPHIAADKTRRDLTVFRQVSMQTRLEISGSQSEETDTPFTILLGSRTMEIS